ncbi:MAG: hypothetical protein RM049_26745 [Nostoc sp. DedQUE04]|uniref:hypothetical protein n=1 Tax=Nostoc sp. DedQUE04 TaxID=3075390 RepID=UPI002AD3727F|nr:hypothetical protein [Nostoc sp. DedQUE04]MDZ8138859.1 hypothetical protein [Nostoc sp. DedQUE04]
MNQNQIKVIQSRLKSRNKKFTLEQIRTYVLTNYHDEELTEDQILAIVDKLSGSDARGLANTALSKIVPADTSNDLSQVERQGMIEQVASTLEIDLSVEQVKRISSDMDWALSDRAALKKQICTAIIAWADHKFNEDATSTDEMMEEVEAHFLSRLKENNQHFNRKVNEFSGEVSKAINKFRTTEAEVLDLFKISR